MSLSALEQKWAAHAEAQNRIAAKEMPKITTSKTALLEKLWSTDLAAFESAHEAFFTALYAAEFELDQFLSPWLQEIVTLAVQPLASVTVIS